MKKLKKGFTIVELVIVVAVIAILAGVLIPVFSNVVDKAKKSKDTQLIRNLNEALAVDMDEHNTMYDALQAAKEFGYDVGRINVSATDHEILWDSVNDCFVYLNNTNPSASLNEKLEYIPGIEPKSVQPHQLWKISTTVSEVYSTYYTGNDTEVTVETGFDAGEKTGITVNVVTDKEITLTVRTNSVADVVKAQAPDATIYFYGFAGEFDVLEVDSGNCLHVFGQVEFLSVTSGKVIVGDTAVVKGLHINADTANVEVKAQAVVEAVTVQDIALANRVSGVTSSEIKQADAETAKASAKLFAAGNGSKDLPYIIETAEQFKNINELAEKEDTQYFKLAADVVFAGETINVFDAVIDLDGFTLTIEDEVFYVAKSIEVKNGTIEYLDGVTLLGANQAETANVSLKFDSLVLNGDIKVDAYHYGPLTDYLYAASYKGNYEISANKVISNVNITNIKSGDVGGLFGYIQGSKVAASVTNCTVNGTIQSKNVGGFLNTTSYPKAKKIVNSGNTLNGSLLAAGGSVRAFGLNSNYNSEVDTYTAQNELVTVSAAAKLEVATAATDLIKIGEDNQILINHTNTTVTEYIVELEYWVNRISDNTGGYPRPIRLTIQVSAESGDVETGLYKIDFDQVDSDAGCPEDAIIVSGAKIWKDGDSYKIYDPYFALSGTKAYIYIYGYAGEKLITLQGMAYAVDIND